MEKCQVLVPMTTTRKNHTMNFPNGGILSLIYSLKKRLEHGSCFENLSFTPAPGAY